MHHSLLTDWQKAEALKKDFMDDLSSYSTAQQNFHPSEAEWNMLGVADHLIKAERATIKYIKYKVGQQKSLTPGWDQVFKVIGLKIALWLPIKYKAPANSDVIPGEGLSMSGVESSWTAVRKDMKDLLDSFPNEYVDKMMFKHPLAGPMRIGQAIEFWQYHIRHHFQQVNRIKTADGFPKK